MNVLGKQMELNPSIGKFISENIVVPKELIKFSISDTKKKNYCYFSVADKDHAKMAAVMVKSARASGVKEDFHIWTDLPSIKGAVTHPCGDFSNSKVGCWFKLNFLMNEVSKLDYDYFVWLDADHYFVRKPRSIMEHVDGGLVMVPMENEISSVENKRGDWWGVPTRNTIDLFREFGCKGRKIYNTNGGLFVVKKDFITTFYYMCYDFFKIIKKEGLGSP